MKFSIYSQKFKKEIYTYFFVLLDTIDNYSQKLEKEIFIYFDFTLLYIIENENEKKLV